ncbi:hypothetical protein [Flammeovirga sp. OC4]|uniref:hypothetical protein n=1 Tax=Flammeovirga sp. OC4 TaxID=1382345 RepID=UPI0005C60041|nr:hypothetical protein [Flammeovirga sp. OC4]
MHSSNIEMLQTVAEGLKGLPEEMVFVGGAVAELYASHPELSDIRPTLDVDCVIELQSRIHLAKLEDDLRKIGFANDVSEDAPICRWVYKGIKVDIMPSDPTLLGFSNTWYDEGIENKIVKILPDKTEINVFAPEYYLAAKFEAHNGRGGNDLRQSHDFEDIIYILGNCDELLDRFKNSNETVKQYLKEQCINLLSNDSLEEGIESALPYGSEEEEVEIIMELIQNMAKAK